MNDLSKKSLPPRAGRQQLEVVSPVGHWAWKDRVGTPQAVKVGNIVYIGGQVSLDQHGDVLGSGDIEIQTRNVFENMVAVLVAAGASMRDLAKLHTYYVHDVAGHAVTEYWERM